MGHQENNEPEAQRVEEDTNAEATEDQNPPGEQQESGEAPPADEAGTDDSKEEGGDELPKWARDKLTKANAEAANYRTRLREAEEKLKNVKTLDEVDQLLADLKAKEEQAAAERAAEARALLVENVALAHRLPTELAELLKGDTREELEEHAKVLQKFAVRDDDDVRLEGGLSPRDREVENLDPGQLARKYGKRKRR